MKTLGLQPRLSNVGPHSAVAFVPRTTALAVSALALSLMAGGVYAAKPGSGAAKPSSVAKPSPGSKPSTATKRDADLVVSLTMNGNGTGHLTQDGSELECSGGEWQFGWSGRVPGETADPAALLAGDGMFFTTEPKGGWKQRPSLSGQGINCTRKAAMGREASGAFQGRLVSNKDASVDVQVSMDQGNQYLSVDLADVASCRVTLDGGATTEAPVSLRVASNQQNVGSSSWFSRPINFTKEELTNGFSKTWQFTSSNAAPTGTMCMGQQMQGEVTLRYKAEANDPEIEFSGCLHVRPGQGATQGRATAKGSPPGGIYDFNEEPSKMLDIAFLEGEMLAWGLAPGRGEVTASYRINGKTASKSLPASVVDFKGFEPPYQHLVEIGLWDADGNPTPPLNVPFRSLPAGAGDLLVFKMSKPAIASVAPRQNSVDIQAVSRGQANLNVATQCGDEFIEQTTLVRVVACDKETREKLERRKQNAKQRNDTISKRVQELLNDPEFERVEREIAGDVKNLAFKTGYTIVSALSMAQGSQIKAAEARLSQLSSQELKWLTAIKPEQAGIKAIKEVVSLYGLTSSLMSGMDGAMQIASGEGDNSESYKAAVKGVLSGANKLIKNEKLGFAKTFIEAAMAAQKMGRNVGTLAGVADRIAELDEQHADVRKEWERVAKLIKRCDSPQPKDEELELIAPISQAPEPGKRPPSGKTSKPPRDKAPVEIVPEQPGQQPPSTQPIPEPIEDPVASKPGMSLPLCVASSGKPADVAKALRRAESAYDAYAARMNQAAKGAAVAYERVLEDLIATAEQGPEALRRNLPRLKVQHDEAYLALAKEGDAAVKQLGETEQCDVKLPGTSIDIKKIEWKLGP